MNKRNWKSNFFYYLNKIIIILFCGSIIFPFISLLFTSLTTSAGASMGSFNIDWDNLTLENYKSMLNNKFIWSGYRVTLFRTIVGTVLSVLMTSIGAYCMSRPYFPNRAFWMSFIIFTMYFGGGLIPTYVLYCSYGLKDSVWVMILPGLVGAYNLIIMRNFFQQVPASLEESARIDGAGDLRILFSIMYPVSKPVLMTVALWVAVGHWNSWYDCLVYIRDTNKFVLQIVLRRIVLQGTTEMMKAGLAEDVVGNPDGLKAAAIFVTTIPILCVYPFVQKYFVKGVMVGSLKG